jgi:hypothetical protein
MVRRNFTEEEMAIGPGSYAVEPKFGDDGVKVLIQPGWRNVRTDNVPGPGHY